MRWNWVIKHTHTFASRLNDVFICVVEIHVGNTMRISYIPATTVRVREKSSPILNCCVLGAGFQTSLSFNKTNSSREHAINHYKAFDITVCSFVFLSTNAPVAICFTASFQRHPWGLHLLCPAALVGETNVDWRVVSGWLKLTLTPWLWPAFFPDALQPFPDVWAYVVLRAVERFHRSSSMNVLIHLELPAV